MRRMSPRARRTALQLAPVVVIATLVAIAASVRGGGGDSHPGVPDPLSGSVAIDGAAALHGPTETAAARFRSQHPGVRVTVGASGDENAIATFCAGEVDIAAVARRLGRAERRSCRSAGTGYRSIELGREGIVLVVSKRNRFARCLSVEQVREAWRSGTPAASWSQLEGHFPAIAIEPVGWKPDSAAYTLLSQALFGRADPRTRNDYEVVDDAGTLSEAVAASPSRLGYLPLGELRAGAGIRPLALDGGKGCVMPSATSVGAGTYPALSRPLYLDVNDASLRRPEVRRFLRYYLGAAPAIGAATGVVVRRYSHRVYRKFTRP